jgi:hypothetical protein
MKKFQATVKLQPGNQYSTLTQKVYVEADNANNAKLMIESQYGKGCISGSVTPA